MNSDRIRTARIKPDKRAPRNLPGSGRKWQADTLTCYTCRDSKCERGAVKECNPGEVCVVTVNDERKDGDLRETIVRTCARDCVDFSLNLGWIRFGVHCCGTDLCNQDPVRGEPSRELQCDSCLQPLSDFQCNQTGPLACSSREDKCAIFQPDLQKGRPRKVKLLGCVSESFCYPNRTSAVFGTQGNISCCDGNLCNGGAPDAPLSPGLLAPIACLLLALPRW